MIINETVEFNFGDTTEKLIYQPSEGSKYGTIRSLTISTFLPTIPLLTTPEKGLLTLANEWDERYAEFVKLGKHRRLGIYFKFGNSNLIRRFGILLFNKSPAQDIDLLAMLITRPEVLSLKPTTGIYGKIEPGGYGVLGDGDTVSIWILGREMEIESGEENTNSAFTSLW